MKKAQFAPNAAFQLLIASSFSVISVQIGFVLHHPAE
jgi:hypothetical protein